MQVAGPRYKCSTCNLEFRHESEYIRHQNNKRPCLPPGDSRYCCKVCDVPFKRQAKLEAHFLSKKHLARQAEIDAREAPAIPEAQPESSRDRAAAVPQFVPIKPLDFGKCDNRALDELEKLSGKELMTRLSINPGGCGFTPFAKLFRVLFLDDKVPSNINVLMVEDQGLDATTYYFRQGYWRESDCPELALEDCLNISAVQMSNITHILARVMHHTALDKFERVRETIERQTSRGITRLSKEVLSLLQAVNLAIVRFTKAHPELLSHAKADAEAAPRFRWMQKTRDLPTWQIGGAAWKRNAKFLETGQWVNPTWDDE